MVNRFGTTSAMVIQPVQENGVEYLLAIDEKGLFLTTSAYVDKNRADPNRYTTARANVNDRLVALQLDPAALVAANQHLIQKTSTEPKKKINPLKASKRAMAAK